MYRSRRVEIARVKIPCRSGVRQGVENRSAVNGQKRGRESMADTVERPRRKNMSLWSAAATTLRPKLFFQESRSHIIEPPLPLRFSYLFISSKRARLLLERYARARVRVREWTPFSASPLLLQWMRVESHKFPYAAIERRARRGMKLHLFPRALLWKKKKRKKTLRSDDVRRI